MFRLIRMRNIFVEIPATLQDDTLGVIVIMTLSVVYVYRHLAKSFPETLFVSLVEKARTYREADVVHLLAGEHWLRGWSALAQSQFYVVAAAFLKTKVVA